MELLKERYDEQEFDKSHLIKIFALSAIIDIVSFYGVLASLGLGVVVEEAIEYFISQQIAKYGKIKLSKMDNMIGALPIPGVTAVTVHCARKLFSLQLED